MNNIRSEREKKNLTQNGLGEKLGVSHMSIRNWERGLVAIPSTKLIEMSELFGCTIDYLLGKDEE